MRWDPTPQGVTRKTGIKPPPPPPKEVCNPTGTNPGYDTPAPPHLGSEPPDPVNMIDLLSRKGYCRPVRLESRLYPQLCRMYVESGYPSFDRFVSAILDAAMPRIRMVSWPKHDIEIMDYVAGAEKGPYYDK